MPKSKPFCLAGRSSRALMNRMGTVLFSPRTVPANSNPSVPGIMMSEMMRSYRLPYMAS